MKKSKGPDRLNIKFLDILASKGISPEELSDDLKGKPVHIPQVNFDVPLEQKARASMGAPPYAIRAKYIEDNIAMLEKALAIQWKETAEAYPDDHERFARVWTAIVETIELDRLNELIKEHNTFYPIEANLKEHPETGKIMIGNTVWKPKKKLSSQALLEKFPPDRDKAMQSE